MPSLKSTQYILKMYEYAENFSWISRPLLHGFKGTLRRHITADETINRTGTAHQIADDSTEV